MKWKNTLKFFALVNSLILLSVFLLVKGNYIDIGFMRSDKSTQQVAANSIGLPPEMATDTLPKMDSVKLDTLSNRKTWLSSSKSLVLTDLPKKTDKKKQDTTRKKKTTKQ